MKTCGNHKDAVVVYADIRDRFLPKGVRLVSCPICRVMRGMEDASAEAINESEEQIRKLKVIVGSREEQIRSLDERLGDAEEDVAICQCPKCALLRGIDSLSTCSPFIECCQKSEKTLERSE